MRLLAFLSGIYRWLVPDKRSEWEQKRERSFINAVNQLKNYSVSDQGGLSMDPEEIRDYIIARRHELSHLVDPKYRDKSPVNTSHLATGTFVELISWRRLSSQAAIRYVCLQALDGREFSVASARYYSAEDSVSTHQDEMRRIAQRLMGVGSELPLEWHPTLAEALEAHDRAI